MVQLSARRPLDGRMRQQRVGSLANQQPGKRKWSDWSECNENCLKTRHRTNCDDLLDQANDGKRSIPTSGDDKQKSTTSALFLPGKSIHELIKRETEALLPDATAEFSSRIDQAADDDGDYGDEGDDETETDSCANVDSSKTFEEIACVGGRCPISIKENVKLHIAPPPTTRPLKRPPAVHYPKVNSIQQPNSTTSQGRLAPVVKLAANETLQPQQQPELNSNQPDGTKGQAPPSSGSIWTRGMWPSNFPLLTANSDHSASLSQQISQASGGSTTNIIQWTILIGSLLTIILLILLILRKLFVSTFPSYQWMLAKQTLKSSSKQLGSMDCCHQRHSLGSASGAPCRNIIQPPLSSHFDSATDLASHSIHHHHHHHRQQQQQQQPPPPHRSRYGWPNTNLPKVAQLSDQLGYHACVVETANGGRHHLLGCGSSLARAEFNTDHPSSSEIVRHYMDPSAVSAGRLVPGEREIDEAGNSVISSPAHYNCDTLNSCYGGRSASLTHKDKGFVLDKDFVAAYPVSTCRDEHQSYLSSHRQIVDTQHGDKDQTSRRSSSPVDSESASGSGSGSNASIQSTTAQLLSRGASSSFEQPPEFGECSTVATSNNNSATNIDANASPASLGGAVKRRPSQRSKLAGIMAVQTVQSQPNSPMFANQFANRHNPSSAKREKAKQVDRKASSSQEPSFPQSGTSGQSCVVANVEQTGARKRNSTSKQATRVLRIVGDLESTGQCDNGRDDEDRHYYEEISHPEHK